MKHKKHPEATIDDFVVYVNYTKPTNAIATGQPFSLALIVMKY